MTSQFEPGSPSHTKAAVSVTACSPLPAVQAAGPGAGEQRSRCQSRSRGQSRWAAGDQSFGCHAGCPGRQRLGGPGIRVNEIVWDRLKKALLDVTMLTYRASHSGCHSGWQLESPISRFPVVFDHNTNLPEKSRFGASGSI